MSIHYATTTFTVTKENFASLTETIIDQLCQLCPYLSPSESQPAACVVHTGGMAGFYVSTWGTPRQWFGFSPVVLVDETVDAAGYIRHGSHYGLGGSGLYNTCTLDVTYDDNGYVSASITGYYNDTAATTTASFALLTDMRTGEDRVATFTQSSQPAGVDYTPNEPTYVYIPATGSFYALGKYPGADMSEVYPYVAAGGPSTVCCAIPTLFYAKGDGVSNLMVWKNEKYRSCVFQGGRGESLTTKGSTITIDGKQAMVLSQVKGASKYTNFILFE